MPVRPTGFTYRHPPNGKLTIDASKQHFAADLHILNSQTFALDDAPDTGSVVVWNDPQREPLLTIVIGYAELQPENEPLEESQPETRTADPAEIKADASTFFAPNAEIALVLQPHHLIPILSGNIHKKSGQKITANVRWRMN